jgi:protein-glutamine gamma-glutamyltransferase
MSARGPATPGSSCHGVTAFPAPLDPAERRVVVGDTGLRVLAVVVVVCGLGGMARATLLSAPLALSGALACVAASAAAWHWPSGTAVRVRRLLSFGALLGTFAALLNASGGALVDDLGPTLGMCLVGLAVAHCLVEDTRRDLVVGVLIGCLMLVLAAGVAPGSAIAVPVVGGWLAVLAVLVLAHRSAAADLAHVAATPPRSSGSRSVAWTVVRSVGVVALVGAFLLLLVPHPGGLSLRSRLARGDAGEAEGAATRPQGSFDGGSMDLLARGSLSTEPVLKIPADSPELWRGTVLDTYADNRWSVSPATGSGTFRTLPSGTLIPPGPLEGPLIARTPRTDVVLPYPSFSGVVVAPGRVVAVESESDVLEGPGSYFLDPFSEAVAASGSAVDGVAHSLVYEATSVPVEDIHSVTGPSGSTADAATAIDPIWTALPSSLPPRVVDLGRSLVAPTTDPAEAVVAVEDFVRNRARYTLDSPLPKPGEDAVDDFLFNSHLGFCEHFASAEVVLLRAGGIPARVVTGYAGGTDNGDGTRTFHGTEAHAWVEAWLPGHGWVSSDPTAGAELARDTSSWLSSLKHRLSALLHSAAGRLGVAAVLAAVTLVGFVLVTLFRRWRRRRARTYASAEPEVDELDPLPAFRRLEATLVGAGVGRAVDESVTELGRRLPTDAVDADAFRAVDETCYAATPPALTRREAASARLDALTEGWRARNR